MAYSTSNPPIRLVSGFGGSPSIWAYTSGDAHTDVDATDYFTNAKKLGMKVGDIVHVTNSASSAYTTTTHAVSAIDADGNGTISSAVLA